MYRCTYCQYSTPYLHNLKRHEKNKHSNFKAPTNTLLQPKVVYPSTEIPQHLTGYQVRQRLPVQNGVLNTTQQYDPRSKPQIQYNEINHQGYDPHQITGHQLRQGLPVQNGSDVLNTTQQHDPKAKPQMQYNEVRHQGYGPQTSANFSLTQNSVSSDDSDDEESNTETVSDKETDNESEIEEHDIYEILNDIHLGFNHLKNLRDQYRKALPQIKELDNEEMNQFLYKYAELKIDVIDEQDGLEERKVQTGCGIESDEEYENGEGDTDEEAVDDDDDQEAVDDDDEPNDEPSEMVKSNCKECLKERFFDFIFEAEEFMSSDSHKQRVHYEKIFREDITDSIEKDENNKPEDVDEIIDDVEYLRNEFDKDGNMCFKYCSKRKINSISDMVGALLDNEVGDDLKKSNPSKFRYIKALLQPYIKSIRKLGDQNVDIHEKRKVLQNPDVAEGVLESVESVVTPLLKKKRIQ